MKEDEFMSWYTKEFGDAILENNPDADMVQLSVDMADWLKNNKEEILKLLKED